MIRRILMLQPFVRAGLCGAVLGIGIGIQPIPERRRKINLVLAGGLGGLGYFTFAYPLYAAPAFGAAYCVEKLTR
jgi:hypothetical protein